MTLCRESAGDQAAGLLVLLGDLTRLLLLVSRRFQRVELAVQLGFTLLEIGDLRIRLVQQPYQFTLVHRFVRGFSVIDLAHVGETQQRAHQSDENRG